MVTSLLTGRRPRYVGGHPRGRPRILLLAAVAGGGIVTVLAAGPSAAQLAPAPPMPGTTPGAAIPAPDETLLFYTGTDRAVYYVQLPPETSPFSLGGRLIGGPAPVWTSPGSLAPTQAVFGRGTDNALWWTDQTASGSPRWASLGGKLTSKPSGAVVTASGPTAGQITAWVRGTDGGVWYKFRNARGWSPWQRLGGRLLPGAAPAAADVGATAQFVAAVGTDRAVWLNVTSDGSRWSGWRSLGGRATSAPAATYAQGALLVFVRGTDNAAWGRQVANPWAPLPRGWRSLGGKLTSGIGAATSPIGVNKLFALGTDNQVWEAGGRWPMIKGWARAQ